MRNSETRAGLAGLLLVACLAAATGAHAALDIRNASRQVLDSGLTLIVLEDRNFPVASVQMLYRVGARDETTGLTGLAHFLEHMAFRSSDHFPGTGLVSSIYAVGGEWHGYTWLDQTTYFATAPREDLDMLLRIEADRMIRLTLSADDMEAERGAVLAEMHMYENYPSSMLIDAVMFASFQAHPYRNNTIGFESDIENLQHAQVVDFYRRHYHPANAVLVIVGDVDTAAVQARVAELFADAPVRPATPLPHTLEPIQRGERRVRLSGPASEKRFLVAYRAPAASDPDYAAFLVLQELLGGSSGVSFLQNDWGTPVKPRSALYGAADDLTTWFPPGAQDYVFAIGGSAPPDADEAVTESAVEASVASLRNTPVAGDRIAVAIDEVLDQLVFDIATTEDAAHQLAFFEGLGAYDVLLTLPARVRLVDADDVQRAARRYLQPERRTIGWHVPGGTTIPEAANADEPRRFAPGTPAPVDVHPAGEPQSHYLPGGLPFVLRYSDLSSSVFVQLVLPAGVRVASDSLSIDPYTGLAALSAHGRPGELGAMVDSLRATLASPEVGQPGEEPSADPETRLGQVFDRLMSSPANGVPTAPLGVVLTGDYEPDAALRLIEQAFGDVEPAARAGRAAGAYSRTDVTERIGLPIAQAQLGYLVPAPPPDDADAWRVLLYILSHGYGGRLGDHAISRRGLAYYIDARYRSDGSDGWISLAAGVDPAKLDALIRVFDDELARLVAEPPTQEEIDEARRHFTGRARSAAQGNDELAAELARQLAWYGRVLPLDDQLARWQAVNRDQVIDAIPTFVSGAKIIVRE